MIKRIYIYLKEMFPLPHALSVVLGTTLYWMINLKSVQQPFVFSFEFVITLISMVSFVLLIRIADEFKDYQDDLKNYPNRPLPSGRVTKNDLIILASILLFII